MGNQKKDQSTPPKTNTSNKGKEFLRYDEYWLRKGRTIIDNSIETFSKRLASLNNFLNYLALGTFLGGISYTTYLSSSRWEVYVAFVIPLVFIAIAKFFVTVGANEVVIREADMRSPTQINETYNNILGVLASRIKYASNWVAGATFFAAVGFPTAIFLQNREVAKEIPDTFISVTTDSQKLYLKGSLGDIEDISAVLYGKDSKKKPKPPVHSNFLLEKKGRLNATIDLNELGFKLEKVELFYSVKGKKQKHSLSFGEEKSGASQKDKKKEKNAGKPVDSLNQS